MKKTVTLITFLVLLLLLFIPNVNAAKLYYNDEYHDYYAGDIRLVVNGREVTNLPMHPVVINDYTMVPVREVFEQLGSQVIWHDDTCRVELVDNQTSVFVKIGDRNTIINGQIVPIEEPQPLPMLIGPGPELLKSMVPVRFVAERLGYDVAWDDASRTVTITGGNSLNDEELIIGGSDSGDIYEENTGNDNENPGDEENLIPDEEGKFGAVTAESDDEYDYIYIAARYGISPEITRFSNPERVVFDFKEASFPEMGGTVELDGNCVDSVRYANREGFARLVLDVSCKTQVAVMSSERGILIRAQKSENTQIVYDAFQERVYFDKTYVGSGKAVENGYSVTFTSLKLKDQKIKIDDGIIYEIIIKNSALGCTVTVDGSNKLQYKAEKGFFRTDTVNVIPEQESPRDDRTKPLIVIDAGHGGHDPGAVGYNSNGKAEAYESHINLAIALKVGEKLKANGADVIYTRDKDEYISLKDRAELANNSECDMFVSIHCNAIDNGEIKGTQVYYHPVSETGTELAENVYDKIVELSGLSPKKTQNGAHLYVIRTTTSPAILVETAFISNKDDRKYLLSSKGQETLAEAIYQGIIETIK